MGKVIQFENLVPEVYVDESRDFQMLCALLNLAFNACKYQVDGMRYLNYPPLCPDQLLPSLSKKLGYDYQTTVYTDELRKILMCFKRLVSWKGSLKGIKETVNLFMNVKHIYFKYAVSVRNNNDSMYPNCVIISIYDNTIDSLDLLSDILRYILPCGYTLRYTITTDAGNWGDVVSTALQDISFSVINSINNTAVSEKGIGVDISGECELNDTDAYQEGIINAFNTMQVVSQEQIDKFKDNDGVYGIRVDEPDTEGEGE